MKECKKCREVLAEDKFYNCKSAKDGLQLYCKKCQGEYNKLRLQKKHKKPTKKVVKKLIKNQLQLPLVKTVKVKTPEQLAKTERATKLKRLSTYHIHYGLEYEIVGKQKKYTERTTIKFKCLTCGKTVVQNMDTAWAYRFNCVDCASHIPGLPTNDLVKPDTFRPEIITPFANKKSNNLPVVHQETFTATWEPSQSNCTCQDCFDDCKECEQVTDEERDQILEKIKELRKKLKEQNLENSNVHVLILEVPKYEEQLKKESIWKKLKRFFHLS